MTSRLAERDIQAAILGAVGSMPHVRLWRSNTGAARNPRDGRVVRFGVPGQGDLSGIIHTCSGGVRLEIEVKSATGRQSPEQRRFQLMIERFGGCYVLARSVEDATQGIAAFLAARNLTGVTP